MLGCYIISYLFFSSLKQVKNKKYIEKKDNQEKKFKIDFPVMLE